MGRCSLDRSTVSNTIILDSDPSPLLAWHHLFDRTAHSAPLHVSKFLSICYCLGARFRIYTFHCIPHTSTPFPVTIGLGLPHCMNLCVLEDIAFRILYSLLKGRFPEVAELVCPPLRLMATLLPPPQRRKLYHGIPEPVKEPELPSTSIVVQFVNEENGKALAPAVNLPANLSKEALESLLNKLSRQVIASTILDTRMSHFDFLLAGGRSSTVRVLRHCTGRRGGIECSYSNLRKKFFEAGHTGQPQASCDCRRCFRCPLFASSSFPRPACYKMLLHVIRCAFSQHPEWCVSRIQRSPQATALPSSALRFPRPGTC